MNVTRHPLMLTRREREVSMSGRLFPARWLECAVRCVEATSGYAVETRDAVLQGGRVCRD